MAEIVGGFLMAHDPLAAADPGLADPEQCKNVMAAYDEIARRLKALEVDTVVTVGDDHYHMFGPNCVPRCLIGVGDVEGPLEDWLGIERRPVPNNQPLAEHIVRMGFADGIDWSVAKTLIVDHAAMIPIHFVIDPASGVRTIPVYLNACVEPFISSQRAAEIGASIRRAVQSWPGDERVAVFGTGGISHWVGSAEMGRVNEEFDQKILSFAAAGDIDSLLALSDETILEEGGNGALEIKNWICAMAALPGYRADVIAYEPIPQWICGCGFAELRAA